ncbi:MAG: NB-ARC domain-containing protein [Bacteroidales bacterium]|nr:NB-ARC domain-containing protein [Bacteroidales bacterium]
MTKFVPIQRMLDRLENEKNDSDTSAFHCLLYTGEVVIKSVTLAVAACVNNRPNKSKYLIHHRLVRANAIGDWVDSLREMLYGPTAQFVDDEMQLLTTQITRKVGSGEWQHDAVACLHEILCDQRITHDKLPPKVSLFDWFSEFVMLRNKTRGHGAPTGTQCSKAAKNLDQSIGILCQNIDIFNLPWAHLRRNLSGKYRVTYLSNKSEDFDFLKGPNDECYKDGIYISMNGLRDIQLMATDADLSEIYFANGMFKNATYDMLSYESNSIRREPNDLYLQAVESLPISETQGLGILDAVNNCFTNIPASCHLYVPRNMLEEQLEKQILLADQHPIVSLTGPGGIGKTTLAIKVINKIMNSTSNPYYLIIWFSARDIDLLTSGPKLVQPHLLSKQEFADEYVRLVEPGDRNRKDFSSIDYFSKHLSSNPLGPTLYIFDNFETVTDQKGVYNWIDSFVRLPNKVIITTRSRAFKADYPINISGMTKDETKELISAIHQSRAPNQSISNNVIDEIYRDSGGHPYVIKILVGSHLSAKKHVSARKIIESQDELLTALFERTFDNLSPLSKKIFMLLSNWYSMVPEVAIEAIQLRSADECLDAKAALDELIQSSFVEEVISETDDQVYIDVPFVASTFGKKKLKVSPLKASVESETEYLKLLGPTNKSDLDKGVFFKIQTFVNKIARITSNQEGLNKYLPTLDLLARRVPGTWVLIARLVTESGDNNYEVGRDYYLKYVEDPNESFSAISVWNELIMLSFSNKQYQDELHFLVEHSLCASDDLDKISEDTRKMNYILSCMRKEKINIPSHEKTNLVEKQINLMLTHKDHFDANDCSRVAWLYNAINESDKANEIARRGHEIDPENIYCQKLLSGAEVSQ